MTQGNTRKKNSAMSNTHKILVFGTAAAVLGLVVYYYGQDPPRRTRPPSPIRHRANTMESKLIEEQNEEFLRSQQEDIRKERERKEKEELVRATEESLRYVQEVRN
jgi:hypothetical protein